MYAHRVSVQLKPNSTAEFTQRLETASHPDAAQTKRVSR